MKTRSSKLKEGDADTNVESVETSGASVSVEGSPSVGLSNDGASPSEGKTGTNTDEKTNSVDVVPGQATENSDEDPIRHQSCSEAQEGSATNNEFTEDDTGTEGSGAATTVDVVPEEPTEGSSQNDGSPSNQLDSNQIIETDNDQIRAAESESTVQGDAETYLESVEETRSVDVIPEDSAPDNVETPGASVSVEGSSSFGLSNDAASLSEGKPKTNTDEKINSVDIVPGQATENSDEDSISPQSCSKAQEVSDGGSAKNSEFTEDDTGTDIQVDVMSKETEAGSAVTSADSAESKATPKVENISGPPTNVDDPKVEQILDKSLAKPAVSSDTPAIAGADATLAESSSSVLSAVIQKMSTPVQQNPSIAPCAAGTSSDPDNKSVFKDIKEDIQKYKLIGQKFCEERKIAFPSHKTFKLLIFHLYKAGKLNQNSLEIRLIEEALRNEEASGKKKADSNGFEAAVSIEKRKLTEKSQPKTKRARPGRSERNQRKALVMKEIAEKYCAAKKQPVPSGKCFERILRDLTAAHKCNEEGLKTALNKFASSQEKWKQWIQTRRKHREQNLGKGEILPPVMKDVAEMSIDERNALNGQVSSLMEEMRPIAIKHCHAIEAPFPTINYFNICRDLFQAGILNEENLKIAIGMDFEEVCNRPLTNDQTSIILRSYCKGRGIICSSKFKKLKKEILPLVPKKHLNVKHYYSVMYRDKLTNLFSNKNSDPLVVKNSNESSSAGSNMPKPAAKTQLNPGNKGGLNTPKIQENAKSISQKYKPSGGAAGPKPVRRRNKRAANNDDCRIPNKIGPVWSNAQTSGNSFNISYREPWGATSSGTSLNPGSSNYSENVWNDNYQAYREESVTDLLVQTKRWINQKERLLEGLENRGSDLPLRPLERFKEPQALPSLLDGMITDIGHRPSTSWQEEKYFQREKYSQGYDVGKHGEWSEHGQPLSAPRKLSTMKFWDDEEQSLQGNDGGDWRFKRGPSEKKLRLAEDRQRQRGQSDGFHRRDDNFRSRFSDDREPRRFIDEQRQIGPSADFHREDDDFQSRYSDDRQPSRFVNDQRQTEQYTDFHRVDDNFQSRFPDERQPSRCIDERYTVNDFGSRYAEDEPKTIRTDTHRIVSELQSRFADRQPQSRSALYGNEPSDFNCWTAKNSRTSSEPVASSSQVPQGRFSSADAQRAEATLETPPSVEPGETFAVAIVPHDYPQSGVTEEEAGLIRNTLLERIGAQHGVGPRFADTYEDRGAVVFECEDQLTVSWIWVNAQTIKLKRNARLRPTSWRKPQIEISIEVPKMLQNLTPHAICERLSNQNPLLSTTGWKLKLTNLKTSLVFYVDRKSLEVLKSLELRPYLGFSRAQVNIIQE